jgi:hypothetical protein
VSSFLSCWQPLTARTTKWRNKSQQFLEQLKSFSMQKHDNLIKTLTLLTTDGKWWDLLGVFYSDKDHNDEMMWE